MDRVGSYRCDCKSGYTGSNCETGKNNSVTTLYLLKQRNFYKNRNAECRGNLEISGHKTTPHSSVYEFFREDYLLLNHIIIIWQQVIFQCRNRNIKPSLSSLKVKLKNVYQLECSIARQKDSLEAHQKKWKELLPILN